MKLWRCCAATGILSALSLTACDTFGQETLVLESVDENTVEAEYRTLRVIGTETGSGIVEGRPFTGLDLGTAGLLVSFGQDLTLYNEDGEGVPLGRAGSGPREYRLPDRLLPDPEGRVWVIDQALRRAIVIWPTGAEDETIPLRYPGRTAGAAILRDGSWVVNGPGSSPGNLGMILHRFDPVDRGWASFRADLADGAFDVRSPAWIRHLSATPDGSLVAVHPFTYIIEIMDPDDGFSTIKRIERKGVGWLPDVEPETLEGREGPSPSIQDILVDDEGHLFVLSDIPTAEWSGWAQSQRAASARAGVDRGDGTEPPARSLLEVFDLREGVLLESLSFPFAANWIVGPGVICHYLGDLPFPRFELIEVSLSMTEDGGRK